MRGLSKREWHVIGLRCLNRSQLASWVWPADCGVTFVRLTQLGGITDACSLNTKRVQSPQLLGDREAQ